MVLVLTVCWVAVLIGATLAVYLLREHALPRGMGPPVDDYWLSVREAEVLTRATSPFV